VKGRDELARLAESFNATLDALESSIQAQRHLIADASHELRTPISSLRANIQILGEADRLGAEELAGLRRDIVDELDELTALVGDVLELARGATPAAGSDDVRLDEVVEAAGERGGGGSDRAGEAAQRAALRGGRGDGDGERAGGQDRPGGVQPDGQRPQVEPGRRNGGGSPGGRGPVGARPRAGLRGGRPAVRVRPLLPGTGRAQALRLGPGPRDRAPGGRVLWGLRRGAERPWRRRVAAGG